MAIRWLPGHFGRFVFGFFGYEFFEGIGIIALEGFGSDLDFVDGGVYFSCHF